MSIIYDSTTFQLLYAVEHTIQLENSLPTFSGSELSKGKNNIGHMFDMLQLGWLLMNKKDMTDNSKYSALQKTEKLSYSEYFRQPEIVRKM